MAAAVDDLTRGRLRRRAEHIEQQIRALEAELAQSSPSAPAGQDDYRRLLQQWDQNLHRIDFRRAERVIERVRDRLARQGGAALFLLDNCQVMEGDLCVIKIREILSAIGVSRPPWVVEFLPHQSPEPAECLRRLADYARPALPAGRGDPATAAEPLVNTLCRSLVSGDVAFIQVGVYGLSEEFLAWFLTEFWGAIVQDLSQLYAAEPDLLIRVIAILAVREPIVGVLPAEHTCGPREVDPAKIIELPLQKWTQDEIRGWILNFSQLVPRVINGAKARDIAQRIYTVSQRGTPQITRANLFTYLGAIARPALAPEEAQP
jgi:hypothetical protein